MLQVSLTARIRTGPVSRSGSRAGSRPGEVSPGTRSEDELCRLAGFGASLLFSTVLPLIFYERFEHLVGSQVTALLITSAIPAAWTAGKLAVRRRLDPIGSLSVVGFAIGILMVSMTGSAFAFKIHGAVLAGAIGVVFLLSMAIRRPVGLLLMPKSHPWPGMARRTAANWVTGIWGVVLVTDAAVMILLAAALPTRTFLAVGGPVGWSFIALGLGGVIWRRKHLGGAARRPGGRVMTLLTMTETKIRNDVS